MDIVERLKRDRKVLEDERAKACAGYDRAIAEIDTAIDAISKNRSLARVKGESASITNDSPQMHIDDAIVEAVRSGAHRPAKILDHLANQLGINTTINSVRTRVSRLKNDGRLERDSRGWIVPDNIMENDAA